MPIETHQLAIPPEQDGRRLDQALAALLPGYSRSRIKQWIEDGQVLLDGAVPQPRTRVTEGQAVAVEARIEPATGAAPEPIPLVIVHEDDALIVINKPAGLVVHPGAGNPAGTLMNGLLAHDPVLAALPRGGIVHRLDKDTSGLMVVARSAAAHAALVAALERREIAREYRAVCVGRLTAGGTVDAPLGRHPQRRTQIAVQRGGRPAVTHYRVLARFAHHSYIALRLETGRTHQIRVHMAHAGHPLVGDPAYGGRLRLPPGGGAVHDALRGFSRQALHACRLGLSHPLSGESLSFSAPLPDDLAALLVTLSGGSRTRDDFEQMAWPAPAN